MTTTLQDALMFAFTKAVGKTDEEIHSIVFEKGEDGKLSLKDNVNDLLLDMITNKLKAVKGDETAIWDKAWKKAQKETLEKAEKLLSEKVGVNIEGETFEEKISKFVEMVNSGSKNTKQQLSDDDIKKHPLFLSIEQKAVKAEELLKENEKIKNEFEQFKMNYEKQNKINKITSIIEDFVDGKLNLNLDKDQTRRKNQIKLITKEVLAAADDWEEVDGKIFGIKNGKRIEDAQFTPKALQQITKEIALQYFEPLAQTPKGGAGNTTPQTTPMASVTMKERNAKINEIEDLFNKGKIKRDEADRQIIEIKKNYKIEN